MKFTLKWLKEHLDTGADVATIARTLTMIGLEVEGIEDRAKELAPFTIGYVVEAVQHPNADKLRVCKVDTGKGVVQVVCGDRKSTRLNSSHSSISYAVFCLKKKGLVLVTFW